MRDKVELNKLIELNKLKWKDAFKHKAIVFSISEASFGFYIIWYLWSADVWFGKFPLLKFIILMNVLVWLIFNIF